MPGTHLQTGVKKSYTVVPVYACQTKEQESEVLNPLSAIGLFPWTRFANVPRTSVHTLYMHRAQSSCTQRSRASVSNAAADFAISHFIYRDSIDDFFIYPCLKLNWNFISGANEDFTTSLELELLAYLRMLGGGGGGGEV